MTRWRGNPWAILLTLCLGFFMTLLDLTIVNIAMPSMIDQLDASFDEILWVVNAYTLALAVLLITAGRLGDLRGQRKMFILGVALFTAASAACGLSQDPAQLIAARVVQGVGAAILMPQTMAIVIQVFPPQRRGAAMGVWAGVAGLATLAGPTLGGLLVTALDWRWIFFINLPVGIAVLVMAFLLIPEQHVRRSHKFDLTGVLIATAALFCMAFALTEGERFDWGQVWSFISIPLLGAASFLLFVIFVFQQRLRQDAEPLVPFVLFRDRDFSVLNVVGITVSIAMIGGFLPLTIYLQSVLGFSALKAGLVLAPISLVSMTVAPFAGRMSDKIGGKYILVTGMTLYGAGLALIVMIGGVDTHWAAFLPALIVAGFGIGCTFAPMGTMATRNVEPRLAGAASGLFNTTRQIGSVIGGAAIGALLQNRLAAALPEEAAERSAALPPQAREGFVDGVRKAAEGGLEVGASQGDKQAKPPPGTSQQLADQLQELGIEVFKHAFVTAMRPTMYVTAGVALLGAAIGLGVKGRRAAKASEPAPDKAQVGATNLSQAPGSPLLAVRLGAVFRWPVIRSGGSGSVDVPGQVQR